MHAAISFCAVAEVGPEALAAIDPGVGARQLVDYNWYWHGVVARRPMLTERIIRAGQDVAGYVVHGPHCRERTLRVPVAGTWEVYHLVIDVQHQGQGIAGRALSLLAAELFGRAARRVLVVAVNEDNTAAQGLYRKLGFTSSGDRNYDGDPIQVLERTAAPQAGRAGTPRIPQQRPEHRPDLAAWMRTYWRDAGEWDWDAWERM
jgi:ribosomal protein S18 acetylase RimI-like enzyme